MAENFFISVASLKLQWNLQIGPLHLPFVPFLKLDPFLIMSDVFPFPYSLFWFKWTWFCFYIPFPFLWLLWIPYYVHIVANTFPWMNFFSIVTCLSLHVGHFPFHILWHVMVTYPCYNLMHGDLTMFPCWVWLPHHTRHLSNLMN